MAFLPHAGASSTGRQIRQGSCALRAPFWTSGLRTVRVGASERNRSPNPPTASSTKSGVFTTSNRKRQEAPPAPVYDMNLWHYKPWFFQPTTVIAAGVAFIVAANVLAEPGLKTTLLAAAPVALWWYIILKMLPQQFKDFAVDYIREHPECEERNKQK